MSVAEMQQNGDNASAHVEEATTASSVRASPDEMSLSIWQTIKGNPKAIGYSTLLATAPIIYGFDIMIINLAVAMPSFQNNYGSLIGGSYIIPAIWLSLWNSMVQVGAMAGALVTGIFSDRLGRKFNFGLGGIVAILGVFLVYFSDRSDSLETRRSIFLVGKIIVGFALGVINTNSLVLISEFAPARVRGPLLSCFTLFIIVGQICGVASVFARIDILTPSSYRVCFAAQWAFACLVLLVALIIPESPVFYLKQNKLPQALNAYKRLYSSKSAEENLTSLQRVVEHEMLTESRAGSSYLQCFKGTAWRRTRIIIYANILQQLVGITMVSNSTYFLELAGMSASLVLTLSLSQLGLGLPCIMASWFTMTILGRRAILLIGSAAIAVLWLGMGIAGFFPNSPAALWFLGVALIIIFLLYSLSVGAAYPVVSGEMSSMQLRAASQSIGLFAQFVASWAFSFTVPYMFDVDAGNLGGKVGFIFSFLSACGFILVWVEFPETKNRTYAELDEIFEKNLPTRQFKNYICSGFQSAFPSKAEEAGV